MRVRHMCENPLKFHKDAEISFAIVPGNGIYQNKICSLECNENYRRMRACTTFVTWSDSVDQDDQVKAAYLEPEEHVTQ
jgi:hypothetical protein